MNLEWNQAQMAIYEAYRTFAEAHIARRALALSRENAFDHQSWELLCKTDFWKRIVPKEFGGFEQDWWGFIAGLEGMASASQDGGFILTVVSQAAFIHGLNQFGTPEQQSKYFPQLLAGALTATAIAEPHTGTDASALKTNAAENPAGNLILNGKKWNISHAPTATVTLVVGRIPERSERDIALFLVDNAQEGVHAGPAQAKMGNRTIPTSYLEFKDVALSDADVLGSKVGGFKALVETVTVARILDGWMGAMLMKPILEKAMVLIETRASKGRPLSKHQYIQLKITNLLIGLKQSRYTGIGAMSQLLNGHPEAYMTGSIAKLTGAKAFQEAAQEMVNLFGSEGYLEGEISHLLNDAMGLSIVGGTEEMHRINIFNQYRRLSKS